jgi:oligopeptide transport system substrate-binding protein
VYLEKTSRLEYQVARRGWIGDFMDPTTFLELMTSRNGNNNTGWSSKEFDDLLSRSNRAGNRMELLRQAEEILLDEMPVVPIYQYVTQNMWKKDVEGLFPNPMNIHPLNEVVKGDGTGMLVMENHTEVAGLDPGLARGLAEHRVMIGLFEGLLNYDPKTCEPRPGVAEKWEISSDAKTVTFHLRECSWSDGRPVKAADFVYAWNRVVDPKTAADYAHILYAIKDAEAIHSGKGGELGVRAKDDRTLVVELAGPCPWFLDLLPFMTFYPVRRDVVEKHGDDWTKPANFVGNGPFLLKEWVANEHILLEKNGKYWNAARVKQKTVKWLPTESYTTAFNRYEADQCDYLDTIPLEFIEEIRKRPDFHPGPYLGTYYYSFNVTKKPFDDKRVRKALSLAIDRKIITEKILRGGQEPAFTFVPPLFEPRGYGKRRVRPYK